MEKKATIRDIAQALGVTIGTVDRALHGRRGVNPLTKARVLQMAETLGYRPNLAARFLSSKRRWRVSVNIPTQIAWFFDAVRVGIEEEARPFAASGVELTFRSFPRLGQGEEEAFEAALQSGVDGFIIASGRPQNLRPLVLEASRARIPVLCVSTDLPGTERLAVVSIDPLVSGSMAGELLGRFAKSRSPFAVVTGDLQITDHAEKYQAFHDAVQALYPETEVLPSIENHEDEVEAYEKCRQLLSTRAELGGIYVSTANSLPVLQALQDARRAGQVTVITTDLFPALASSIRTGCVAATLYQRPGRQGRLAFRMLHQFLVEGTCPSHQVRLAPHLILRSNLSFFSKKHGAEIHAGKAD